MIRQLVRFYVFSNLHIALSAGLFVSYPVFKFHKEFAAPYIAFVVCGTFLVYNFHRLISVKLSRENNLLERLNIFDTSKKPILFFGFIAFLLGCYSFIKLPETVKYLLFIPIAISSLYIVPAARNQRLRDINFLKIILVSTTWAFVFVLPIINDYAGKSLLVFMEKSLFIFAITIPFDIRDKKIDWNQGLKTLGNTLKSNHLISLGHLLLLISILLATLLLIGKYYNLHEWIALIVIYLLSASLIYHSIDKSEFYHLFYLDGLIGLHGLLLLLVVCTSIQ